MPSDVAHFLLDDEVGMNGYQHNFCLLLEERLQKRFRFYGKQIQEKEEEFTITYAV
jgi:hypothetical protein